MLTFIWVVILVAMTIGVYRFTTTTYVQPTGKRFCNRHRCVNCDVVLSTHEVLYSQGCCPYCGYKSPGTVVRTKEEAVEI